VIASQKDFCPLISVTLKDQSSEKAFDLTDILPSLPAEGISLLPNIKHPGSDMVNLLGIFPYWL
jgi:hypothetical protein